MQIGSLIKYHRTKKKMTQSELSTEICSIPHLSKIENNSKEANVETIKLLLSRLEINIQDVEESEQNIHKLLEQLIRNIHYLEADKAGITFSELDEYKETIAFTKHIYLYEIYKLRYFLFIKDLMSAEEQIRWVSTQKQYFSQHEKYLLSYFSTIL